MFSILKFNLFDVKTEFSETISPVFVTLSFRNHNITYIQ